jgi:hypothetical protein
MDNQQLVSRSEQCSSTPVGYSQGFRNKEKSGNTGESPMLSLHANGLFLLVSTNEISIEGTVLL